MELTEIKGLGKVYKEKLNNSGVYCVEDLLRYMPVFYRDYSVFDVDFDTTSNKYYLFNSKLIKLNVKKARFKTIIEARFAIESGKIFKVNWFNAPYVANALKVDNEYRIYGRFDRKGIINNPVIEPAERLKELCGIKPFYKLPEGVSQNKIRGFINEAINVSTIENDVVDDEINSDIKKIYSSIHSPLSVEEGLKAIDIYKKKYLTELLLAYRMVSGQNNERVLYKYTDYSYNYIINNISFNLSNSQKSALNDIISDLKCGYMRRLLMGDVGSGKSIIAYISAYINARNGYQTVILAPTEILAEQHYDKLSELLKNSGIKTMLLTSANQNESNRKIVENGDADIIIGTHSVLSDKVAYKSLSLIIIDEQHRFGVKARAVLELKYKTSVLMLSATPIPRTLLLTFLNDLKVSSIDNRQDKKQIDTFVISDRKLNDLWQYIHSGVVENKEQAFIVCPRITDDEGECVTSAESLYDELSADVFKDLKLGLLHGKLSATEKNKIMSAFSNREIDILICTTVVEVGIDIPNASYMVVLNAELYGLATLHQLRGRVGRGERAAKCFLHTALTDEKVVDRLIMLTKVNDGRKLAEYDFENRGFGELFGTRQSGGKQEMISVTDLAFAEKTADSVFSDKNKKDRFSREILPKFYDKVKDITLN